MTQDSKTQVFRATTYTEAILKAKKKFGSDFSIVKRRDISDSNLISKLTSGKLGGDNQAVELVVVPGSIEPAPEETPPPPTGSAHPLLRSYAKAMEGAEKHTPEAKKKLAVSAAPMVSVGETATGLASRLDEFQKAMERNSRENATLREELLMLVTLQARGGVPAVSPVLLDCYRRLAAADVSDALAREIVEEMEKIRPGPASPDEAEEMLALAVARRFPTAGPFLPSESGPTVIAVVGASGVGKSTSVVKLAIQFAMKSQMSVGVVNEDLRRPGADSQINNLGRLFGISVSTASEPGEMRDAVRSMAGRDLILLDTGGRSPRDERGIERLAAIIRAAGATETHLLLSGVSSDKTLRETAARYRPTGFNRVILTKLDECVSFGGLLNIGSELSEGISYLTTGPDYTRPIEPADSRTLAELVLGVRTIDAEADESEGRD